jgi:hypothetical protein
LFTEIIKISEKHAGYKKSVRYYSDRIKSYSKKVKGCWLNNSKRERECQGKGGGIGGMLPLVVQKQRIQCQHQVLKIVFRQWSAEAPLPASPWRQGAQPIKYLLDKSTQEWDIFIATTT